MKSRVIQLSNAKKARISKKITEDCNTHIHKDTKAGIRDFPRGTEITGRTKYGYNANDKHDTESILKDIEWYTGDKESKLFQQMRDVAGQIFQVDTLAIFAKSFLYTDNRLKGEITPLIDQKQMKIRFTKNDHGEKFLNLALPLNHIVSGDNPETAYVLQGDGELKEVDHSDASGFSNFILTNDEKYKGKPYYSDDRIKEVLDSRKEAIPELAETVPLAVTTMRYKITEDENGVNYKLVDAAVQINTPSIQLKSDFENRFNKAPPFLLAAAAAVFLPVSIIVGIGIAITSLSKKGREWIKNSYNNFHDRMVVTLQRTFPKQGKKVTDPLYLIKQDNANVEKDMPDAYKPPFEGSTKSTLASLKIEGEEIKRKPGLEQEVSYEAEDKEAVEAKESVKVSEVELESGSKEESKPLDEWYLPDESEDAEEEKPSISYKNK